jgi:hypothetical protein
MILTLAFGGVAMADESPIAASTGRAGDRWSLNASNRVITWNVAVDSRLPHWDRIEMSGQRTAAIVTYKVSTNRELEIQKTLVWPGLRIAPNDTHSSLKIDFSRDRAPRARESLSNEGVDWFEPRILVDGKPVVPRLRQVKYAKGILVFSCDLGSGLTLKRALTPGVENAGFYELWTILASSNSYAESVEVKPLNYVTKMPYRYVEKSPYQHGEPRKPSVTNEGYYRIAITCAGGASDGNDMGDGPILKCGLFYSATRQEAPVPVAAVPSELEQRAAFVSQLFADLRFECPDPILETLFDYSKIRACDSICRTKGGLMHAPGGGAYYAAIWANDTIEYVGPFYPFLGFARGNEATLNAMGHFARFLNPEYNPLPSSIIAEGTDIWARRLKADGLPDWEGDRGDAAMIAYGYSRFLLANGDKAAAEKHWPTIQWALEYCRRHTTADGVVESASDELEGRFSSGKCNLNTSMLTYGGLRSAADLAEELGKADLAKTYRDRAEALHQATQKYFEADLHGFATYRYHEGCEQLRAWICIPLTMGILDRKEGTIQALFSTKLWTDNGILTSEGSTTFWDRSTLYALRGVFNAGEPDKAMEYLAKFSRRRLLGDHVPYVVEAYPEGDGRHLSAESALYCRVITEGLFGLTPSGFRKFTLAPSLPKGWNHMALRRVKAFQSTFDIEVIRQAEGRLEIKVSPENGRPTTTVIQPGKTASFSL